MGKKFDRFIFSALLAVGFYLFYRGTFSGSALCIALALLSCAVCRGLIFRIGRLIGGTRWMQARRFRRKSNGILMRIATLKPDDADALAASLIKKTYQTDCGTVLLQKHPSATVSEDILFDLWKAHAGEEKIAVLATCRMSDSCRAMASGLNGPKLILFDGDAVTDLLARRPELCPDAEENPPVRLRLHLHRLKSAIFNRRNAPRCLLTALPMLAMHFITHSVPYLVCGCLLTLAAILSLPRRSGPVKRI